MLSDSLQPVYPLAQEWWPSSGAVSVFDESGQRLIVLPLDFLRRGQVANFAYVAEQINNCYEEAGVLYRSNRSPVAVEDAVQPDRLLFVRTDGQIDPCTPRRGPRFKYKYRSPPEGEAASTMSNSKRSSANQSKFRDALLARDGMCLITDTLYEACTASHILPQSRPEYYEEVLGYEVRYLFMPSYGLLLRDDLHHAFDRGEIALYPRDQDYLVHVLSVYTPDVQQYHGKVLSLDRFRGPPNRSPNRLLLRFHYEQCAIKYFRGFACGMSMPASES